MDLFIDGMKVDFQLEDEKNLYDLAKEVEKWAKNSGRFLRSLTLKDKIWYGLDESLKEIPIEGLEKIQIETILPTELALEALKDVKDFFYKLSNIPSEKLLKISDLPDSLQWCFNVITKSRAILRLDYSLKALEGENFSVSDWLEKFEKTIEIINKNNSEVVRLKELCDPLASSKIVERLISSAFPTSISREDVYRKIESAKMEIKNVVESVQKITDNLRAGEDEKAMNNLTEVSKSLTEIVSALQHAETFMPSGFISLTLKSGKTISEELTQFNHILKEIVSAFDNRDIVLLCDLLEYELIPGLDTLELILEIVHNEIKTSFN